MPKKKKTNTRKRRPELEPLAARFRRLRRSMSLTQEDMERDTGITQGTISGIENALQRPNPVTIRVLANALKMDYQIVRDFLFDGKPINITVSDGGNTQRRAS